MIKLPRLYINSPQFIGKEQPIKEQPIKEQRIEEQPIEESTAPMDDKTIMRIENPLIARQLQFFARQWPVRQYIFELNSKEKIIGYIHRIQNAKVTLSVGETLRIIDGNEIKAIYSAKKYSS